MISPRVLDEVFGTHSDPVETELAISGSSASSESAGRDRYGARFSYETLLLRQPHVPALGLYSKGVWFYVVCPGLEDAVADDGRPIVEWFEANRQLACPIRLVDAIPQDAKPVPHRTLAEVTDLSGEPLTSRDANLMMHQWLGHAFPFLSLKIVPNENSTALVARPLTDDERNRLEVAYGRLGLWLPLQIEVTSSVLQGPSPKKRERQGDLHLASSRWLPRNTSRQLRYRLEDDEDFWATARAVLWTEDAHEIEALPAGFRGDAESRCLVDSAVCPPGNLRMYLVLHNPATFVLPLEQYTEAFLRSLDVTETELIKLCLMGRVQFVVPQSIDRYDQRFLTTLCEQASDALLFSRRLATETVVKSRSHVPLLYPAANIMERHQLLVALAGICTAEKDPRVRDLLTAVFGQLKRSWAETEYRLQFQGAMGTGFLGLAPAVAELIHKWSSVDVFVEASTAGFAVEWSNALGATLFPFHTEGYSAQRISEACASIYFGIPARDPVQAIGALEPILQGLLTPLNDADVIDLCRVFDGRSTKAFRETVQGIAEGAVTQEDLADEIGTFNRKVREFENREARLGWVDLGAPATFLSPEGWLQYISLAAYIGAKLVSMRSARPTGWAGRLSDRLMATLTRSPREVVFVSRVGRQLTK